MGKGSGWSKWKTEYKYGSRGRDRGDPGKTADSLNHFLETSKGPLSRAFYDIVDYTPQGRLEVDRAKLSSEARTIFDQSKDASYGRDYIVRSEQERIKDSEGSSISRQQAENRINREYANKAKAVLAGAEIGKVRLTEAQDRRLSEIANGRYLDVVYNQFKSGDRGTLEKRREFTYAGANYVAAEGAREEKRQAFLEVRSKGRVEKYA